MSGSAMTLTIIGCSGSYAGPDSAASCYLVEAPDPLDDTRVWRLLVDLGSGALGALQRYADPLAIDAVLLSHLHADHFFDISGYYVLRRYHPDGRQPRIPVHGPKPTRSRVAQAYGLPLDPGMSHEFDFKPLGRPSFTIGPFTVTARRVDHPIEAYGFRIEAGGASLVYSGDTAACDALVDLARGADLLLAEAAFRDSVVNPEHLHMTGSQAAGVAERAGVGELVLTHIPPWHARDDALREAHGAFAGKVSLATEGATYAL